MYTLDEIIQITGIPINRASEVCRLLCSEGYLLFDDSTGKYSITGNRDLLSHIHKFRKQIRTYSKAKQIFSNIKDIITFGKPLALSEKEFGESVQDIGIPGLNIMFGRLSRTSVSDDKSKSLHRHSGLPMGFCLLVKGAPGTGKTTMGMQIAVHLAENRSLFLTFEEDINQLCNDLSVYCRNESSQALGWEKSDIKKVTRSLLKIRTTSAWENTDAIIHELCSILDNEMPQLVVIDSISRFRDLGGETKSRLVLRRLIRILKIRNITSVFLGEDRKEQNTFEDYEVDGIINLEWNGDQLSLRVSKMRGLKSYKGPHSAALLTVDDLPKSNQNKLVSEMHEGSLSKNPHFKVGFNVFPDIFVYNDLSSRESDEKKSEAGKDEKKTIRSGIAGLDNLLPMRINGIESYGFKKGEMVLIIGSAGSGKTLLALQFMLTGYLEKKNEEKGNDGGEEQKKNKRKKVAIWLNLEGDIGTLRFAFDGFEGNLKKNLEEMLSSDNNNYFDFFDFPPLNLDLNKIVYTLAVIDKMYSIDRLVIDSITEMERAKSGGQPEVKSFLAGLIQFLRARKITTIFISRSDTFFHAIDKIEEQILSLIDLIICIRNFDMHNAINRGIYIQKARGREHNSKIMRMTIDSISGVNIEEAGWDVENLLAGGTGNIQGPRVFFKLFYENPSEESINEAIIKDFDETRYPGGEPIFRAVRKTVIDPGFGSFLGESKLGHSNTRVLCIADYVISPFRDSKRLGELTNFVNFELLKKIQGDKHVTRLYNYIEGHSDKFIFDAVPCYRDYGVMVYKPDDSEKMQKYEKFMETFTSLPVEMNSPGKDDSVWLTKGYTWDKLISIIKELDKGDEKIPFAFPPLENRSEFIAFFMELVWGFGGDIYNIPIGTGYSYTDFRRKFKKLIKKRIINDLRACKEYLSNYKSTDEQSASDANKEKCENIKDIFDLGDNSQYNCLNIYEQIEDRFKKYGIGQGRVEFGEFIEFISKNIPGKSDEERLDICDEYSFKEAITLIMKLIHEAGVPNPINGDSRDKAILSRHWYSRIKKRAKKSKEEKKKNKKKNKKHHLLPLPLAKINIGNKSYYRSVSCATYWCLVMLKDALSPEIGGNFIESMNAPKYYEKRLEDKAGMPWMNWELEKQEFIKFDTDSYHIFSRIMNNGIQYEELNKSLSTGDKFEEIFKQNDFAFVGKKTFEKRCGDNLKNILEETKKNEINKRMFFPKYRQTRIAFFQIEKVLHFHLRQLLIPDPRKEEVLFLGDIYKEIRCLCLPEDSEERKGKQILDWDSVLNKIINELRVHLILEFLMYFYHQEKEKEKKR